MGELFERVGQSRRALLHFERANGLAPENQYIRKKVVKLRRG